MGPDPRLRTCEFGPLRIRYDERVLEPRPWTLAQSEWAAELATDAPDGPILELCTGAGHIGLAAVLLTGRRAVLVDADEAACELALSNAHDAGLADLVEVRHGPMDQVLRDDERFAVVIADPPYIPSSETGVFPDDPLLAIDGGDDGLDLARLCLEVAAAHVVPGGSVVLQLRDAGQAAVLGGTGLDKLDQRELPRGVLVQYGLAVSRTT